MRGVRGFKEYEECDEGAEGKSIFCPDKLPIRSAALDPGSARS
jgi:hypothetical protein